ncbi:MAG: cell division protein FtsQ/DivIB [Brachybacterium sp.]|uniref:cell division protein FtsQ/DivIB n=1 Tax=Brachybacterium sp. TaxID=1891286 RepID=UPI003F8FF1CB
MASPSPQRPSANRAAQQRPADAPPASAPSADAPPASAPSADAPPAPTPSVSTSAPAPRARSRSVGRPRPAPETAEEPPDGGRVVQAAGRFRELVVGRPWRRRRRALLIGAAITALLVVALVVTAIFLPALQIREVTVEGTGYVEESDIRAVAEPRADGSVLLLPTGEIAAEVGEVPGVASVEVERVWPDGVRVSITETAPIATLTTLDGSSVVVGEDGQELPAAAGEGETLVPLAVNSGSTDPEGAAAAMSEVLAEMPASLRGAIQEVSASSTSDVTFELALEGGGTRTVVWGDARDAELKAEVVQALLGQPGSVIDVSSPVAPVTR